MGKVRRGGSAHSHSAREGRPPPTQMTDAQDVEPQLTHARSHTHVDQVQREKQTPSINLVLLANEQIQLTISR